MPIELASSTAHQIGRILEASKVRQGSEPIGPGDLDGRHANALCRDPRRQADEWISGKSPRSGPLRIALGGADTNFAECSPLTDASKSGGNFLEGEGTVDVHPYLLSDSEVGNRLEVGRPLRHCERPGLGGQPRRSARRSASRCAASTPTATA